MEPWLKRLCSLGQALGYFSGSKGVILEIEVV
jgi:hypothetical protein